MPLRSSLLLLPRLPYVGQTLSVASCCHADIHMSQNSNECWSIFGPRPAARPKKCTCAACAICWPHRQLSMRDWRTCRGDYKVIPPAPGAFRVFRWPSKSESSTCAACGTFLKGSTSGACGTFWILGHIGEIIALLTLKTMKIHDLQGD